ncbi:RNA-guided endonuclease InsQ/TnpB family protein [Pseudoclavibacter soli]|uniref:RNA-guided endonuclease InsQ/TnpB family protein n=1 Tax=Pseudoclavibacter soli TaxID=452623 RepID=UPI000427270A|nr:transposase [Pseudoclavibacter soli]
MVAKASSPKHMSDAARLAKNAQIKATAKATRLRRRHMICQVRDLKITASHLSATQREQLARLFLEAKWLRNHIIGAEDFTPGVLKELGDQVPVVLPGGVIEQREFRVLGGQARQSILSGIVANLRTLSSLKKRGRKVGRLKFTRQVSSVDLKQSGSTHRIDRARNRVKIQNISGWMRVRGLRQLPDSSEFANAKLVQRPDGYHLMLTTYTPPAEAVGRQTQSFQPGTEVGIDMGVKTHITLSTGDKIDAMFEETDRLRRLRRKLARQKKGSANRAKTLGLIRVQAQKITRRKDDAANKIVHELLKNERVYIQDESLATWKRRSGRARGGKRLQVSVLGRVKQALVAHERVTVLDKWAATTATCVCGHKTKHDPSQRTFTCAACGYTADRDIHAARNMIRLANMATGITSTEHTGTPAEAQVRPAATMNFTFLDTTGTRPMKQEAATSSASP